MPRTKAELTKKLTLWNKLRKGSRQMYLKKTWPNNVEAKTSTTEEMDQATETYDFSKRWRVRQLRRPVFLSNQTQVIQLLQRPIFIIESEYGL